MHFPFNGFPRATDRLSLSIREYLYPHANWKGTTALSNGIATSREQFGAISTPLDRRSWNEVPWMERLRCGSYYACHNKKSFKFAKCERKCTLNKKELRDRVFPRSSRAQNISQKTFQFCNAIKDMRKKAIAPRIRFSGVRSSLIERRNGAIRLSIKKNHDELLDTSASRKFSSISFVL